MNRLYSVSMRICVPVFRKKINLTLHYFVTFIGYNLAARHFSLGGTSWRATQPPRNPAVGERGGAGHVLLEWARNLLLMVKTLCTIYTVQTLR